MEEASTQIYSHLGGLDMLHLSDAGSAAQSMKRVPLEEVVQAHLPTVWRVLRRAGVAEADCDDLCQDVFCIYARKERSVSPGAERSFAMGIALRKAADYRKARDRRPWSVAADGQPEGTCPSPDPEAAAAHRQELARLDAALAEMKDEYRVVFVLVELEQMTLGEAATALGISLGTVSSRLHRGRERFLSAVRRARLEEEGNP